MSDDQRIAEIRKRRSSKERCPCAHCADAIFLLDHIAKQAEALKAVEALAYDLDTGGDPEFHGEQCRYMLFGNDADVVERIRAALASADHRDGGLG